MKRDTNMAEAGEISSMAGRGSRMKIHVSFMAASEWWGLNSKGKRLNSDSSESVSPLGDWRSRMESTRRQQVCEVAQLHQTVDKTARMLKADTACGETQCLSMQQWLDDNERRWDACHKNDSLCGMGITDMSSKILYRGRAGKSDTEAVAERGLQASKHAGPTQQEWNQDAEQQLQWQAAPQQEQQQPKRKSNLPPAPTLTKPPRTTTVMKPTPPRLWEIVPLRNKKKTPIASMPAKMANPGPALTSDMSKAPWWLSLRMDESMPLPNKMHDDIMSAVHTVLFQQHALAHDRIMNAKTNTRGAITAFMHQNATAE